MASIFVVKEVGFNNTTETDPHCGRDALTDSYGWFVQAVLASLAFALLIVKRFCEPAKRRRTWLVWFYDTSKQGLGAALLHFANIFLAGEFSGDPCTWYIVSFLLDSTVGLALVWAGIRLSIYIGRKYRIPTLIFGEYGRPPSSTFWAHQCIVYCGLMCIEKLVVTALMRLPYWSTVRDMILSPIPNPQARVAIVVLVIPFFVNALIFWVTDNFLMVKVHSGHETHYRDTLDRTDQKVMFQRWDSNSSHCNETDMLIDNSGSSDDALPTFTVNSSQYWRSLSSTSTSSTNDSQNSLGLPVHDDQLNDVAMIGVHENLISSPVASPLHVASVKSENVLVTVPTTSKFFQTLGSSGHEEFSTDGTDGLVSNTTVIETQSLSQHDGASSRSVVSSSGPSLVDVSAEVVISGTSKQCSTKKVV